MHYSKIIKACSVFPKNKYSNEEFIKKYNIDSTNEWITSMTGINQRYFVEDQAEFEEICVKAALQAISEEFEKIDYIIAATSTNYYNFPGLSQIVHNALLKTGKVDELTRTLDVNAACNGFMQALSIADSEIKLGSVKSVLILSAEAMSNLLNFQDRSTSVLFSDAASAVLVKKSDSGYVLSKWKHLSLTEKVLSLTATKNNLIMNGRDVFELSVRTFIKLVKELCDLESLPMNKIDLFIFHQANYRIFQKVAKDLEVDVEKIPFLASDFGNTSAASVGCVLSRLNFENKNVILAGFGAGFTSSAVMIRYKSNERENNIY